MYTEIVSEMVFLAVGSVSDSFAFTNSPSVNKIVSFSQVDFIGIILNIYYHECRAYKYNLATRINPIDPTVFKTKKVKVKVVFI